jgi:DNA-binding NtrC family response regulator
MWDGDCAVLNDRVDPTRWTELVNCRRPKRLASRALPGTKLGPNARDEEGSMPEETPEGLLEGRTLRDLLDEYERGLIVSALQATGGNQRRAADRLGVLPTTLHEKLKRLGLRPRPEPAIAEPQRGAA